MTHVGCDFALEISTLVRAVGSVNSHFTFLSLIWLIVTFQLPATVPRTHDLQ
jgi:hypothetical protein